MEIFLHSSSQIIASDYPEPKWIVPGLFPEGLTVLAGTPKTAKSWMMLQLAIAVASGAKFCGRTVDPINVLYFALEDSKRRLKQRMAKQQPGWAGSERLFIEVVLPTLQNGGLQKLKNILATHPAIKLVIIDTLQKVRDTPKANGNIYGDDYAALSSLKELADSIPGLAIIVVTHTKKGKEDDAMAMVTGSTGITGSADSILLLERKRHEVTANLHVMGRDVEEQKLAMRFEKSSCSWELLGEAEFCSSSKQREDILEILRVKPSSPAQLALALDKDGTAVRQLILKMKKAGDVVKNADGTYSLDNTDNDNELEELL